MAPAPAPDLLGGAAGSDLDPLHGLVIAALVLVALGISLAVPATLYFPLVLLALADRITGVLRRVRR